MFKIVLGEDVSIPIVLYDIKGVGRAVILGHDLPCEVQPIAKRMDLSGLTEVTALFSNADGTVLEQKLSLSEVALASSRDHDLDVKIDQAHTAALAPSDSASIELRLDFGAVRTICQIYDAVEVAASLFPDAT